MTTAPYDTITAKIICDSIGLTDLHGMPGHHMKEIIAPRLTTFELTYPRYIHAEIMTHRVLSRNAQSSRAIPVKRRLERVRKNPVKPIRWGANQGGMQAKDEEVEKTDRCEEVWEDIAHDAASRADQLMDLGLHKQWANRLLEPFDTITVVATATNWGNFFALRCHPDAQPEFQNLAWKMADLYFNSPPTTLPQGQWHAPYVDIYDEMASYQVDDLIKASVARCARVSYLNHDRSDPDIAKDIELHDRLFESGHMSPFEHQARVVGNRHHTHHLGGNFGPGWEQYRKTLGSREVRTFDYEAAVAAGARPWDTPYQAS
jgi:thymidylate synthase ThyX